jgi:hypothetical protein
MSVVILQTERLQIVDLGEEKPNKYGKLRRFALYERTSTRHDWRAIRQLDAEGISAVLEQILDVYSTSTRSTTTDAL